jgi:hypothetical protein
MKRNEKTAIEIKCIDRLSARLEVIRAFAAVLATEKDLLTDRVACCVL